MDYVVVHSADGIIDSLLHLLCVIPISYVILLKAFIRQLLIKTASISYGSPHLKNDSPALLTVDFLIFFTFSNFRLEISQSPYLYLPNRVCVSYDSSHLNRLWSCSADFKFL